MIEVTQHTEQISHQQRLYLALDEVLRQTSFQSGAAEAHGIACALICRNVAANALTPLAALLRVEEPQAQEAVASLMEMSVRDLAKTDFDFTLWLPENVSLAAQTAALASWCEGFVLGFCHDGDHALLELGADARELIDDFMEIAHAEYDSEDTVASDSPTGQAPDREGEIAYMQLSEYVRMGVQLIFEETAATTQTSHGEA